MTDFAMQACTCALKCGQSALMHHKSQVALLLQPNCSAMQVLNVQQSRTSFFVRFCHDTLDSIKAGSVPDFKALQRTFSIEHQQFDAGLALYADAHTRHTTMRNVQWLQVASATGTGTSSKSQTLMPCCMLVTCCMPLELEAAA